MEEHQTQFLKYVLKMTNIFRYHYLSYQDIVCNLTKLYHFLIYHKKHERHKKIVFDLYKCFRDISCYTKTILISRFSHPLKQTKLCTVETYSNFNYAVKLFDLYYYLLFFKILKNLVPLYFFQYYYFYSQFQSNHLY